MPFTRKLIKQLVVLYVTFLNSLRVKKPEINARDDMTTRTSSSILIRIR